MSLAPAQEPGAGPWRGAVLTLSNRSARPVRAVAVRMREGGPAFLYPLVVPPEANAVKALAVPVSVPAQEYVLRALPTESASGEALATKTVAVSWPPGRVAPTEFLDPDAYTRHEPQAAAWGGALRRGLFIAAAVACAAMTAALFLRRRPWRLAAALAVALAAAAAILLWTARMNLLTQHVERNGDATLFPAAGNRVASPFLLIVSSPRTILWRHPSAAIVPLYPSPADMARDDAVIEDGRGTTVTIHGGEVRIFLLPGRE